MTIKVTGPGGVTVDFPDGTDAATINRVMSENFSPEKAPAAPPPDKYQRAAIEERAALNPGDAGFTRRLVHGATLGADNAIMAAAMTPLEMIRHRTLSPAEGYNYAKAREDLILDKARDETGILGTATEALAGAVTGGALGKNGITTGRWLAQEAGLIPRVASSAADSAVIGGVAGANEGNGLAERARNAATGLVTGGVLGGVLPIAGSLIKGAAAPIFAHLKARGNPKAYGETQAARIIHESGLSPDEVALRVVQAANEGQPQFAVADALGNAGQRALSNVARAPGRGRTDVVEALEARQAGQGRRVAGALAEGFDAPQTAAQTRTGMTNARDAAADAEFSAVRSDAKPVDVSSTIAAIDRTLSPGTAFHTNIANDSVEAALANVRARLTDGKSNLTDFEAVARVRGDLADAHQASIRAGAGNKARLLKGALRELDTALENASEGYKAANARYSRASRDIDAIDQGRNAAMRGRPEDTIPAYEALTPEGQAAYRAGYADPLIAEAQSAAHGVNKARPLTNDAFRDEAAAMAPGNDMMQRRIARESTMFETRNHALGGSRTADNLADQAAASVDPHLIGQIVSGNWSGALKSVLAAGHNMISGNTAAVREEIGRILLQNGATVSPAQLRKMVDATVARLEYVQKLARGVGGAATQGLTVGSTEAVAATQRR